MLLFFLLVLPYAFTLHADITDARIVHTIAIGSCNKHDRAQPLWNVIEAHRPEVFLWLGDTVYPDRRGRALAMSDAVTAYREQRSKPEYKKFLESLALRSVLGVWDDHDFGMNNGGSANPNKDAVQELFLNFLGLPADDPRRSRQGVYNSAVFGPAGKRVKIILLDIRYHASSTDMLGDEQWAWLEDQLRSNPSEITLIGSGVQVLTGYRPVGEGWFNFEHSRMRLLSLVEATKTSGVIVLSGDVHFAEMTRSTCITGSPVSYPLYELTSSGLTHSWFHYGIPRWLVRGLLGVYAPSHERIGHIEGDLNFGVIKIDWDAIPVTVTLESRGVGDVLQLAHTIRLNELQITGHPTSQSPQCTSLHWMVVASKTMVAAVITYLLVAFLAFKLFNVFRRRIVRCCGRTAAVRSPSHPDKNH